MYLQPALMRFFDGVRQWVEAWILTAGIITPRLVTRTVIGSAALPHLEEDGVHIGGFMVIKYLPDPGFILFGRRRTADMFPGDYPGGSKLGIVTLSEQG